jgi:cell wall-associated NlpC family hydrolase
MIFVRVPAGAYALKSVVAAVGMLILIAGCGGQSRAPEEPLTPRARPVLPRMRYTVQAGAFKEIANAVRLTQKLLAQKLSAYHFIDDAGFYKVRIGNFPTREEAIERAERLKAARTIDAYFIVAPGDYAAAQSDPTLEGLLRREIVRTAERFIGVPYQWGGESSVSGFDCSGLAMVAYQLNGLELPRTSGEQWQAGRPITAQDLAAGDLVFFATRGGQKVSHVGIFTGGDSFLHAPGRGSMIQTASLSNDYFKTRYLGARSYF